MVGIDAGSRQRLRLDLIVARAAKANQKAYQKILKELS